MAEKCTNTSSPVERWMNPYPFAPLNHFTVPFSLTKKLLSSHLRVILPSLFLFALLYWTADTGHSLKATVRILLASPRASNDAPTETAPLHSVERLPATKCRGAAKTKARYPTAGTETSILLAHANRVRLTKHQIIAGRFRLARAKLLAHFLERPETNMTRGPIHRQYLRLEPGVPRRQAVSI